MISLDLSQNPHITVKGYQSLAAVLQHEHSALRELRLGQNNIGDDGALIFATALAKNRMLHTLFLKDCGISAKGWPSFSKVLSDTSSINNTFLSNHTLCKLGYWFPSFGQINSLLSLNHSRDKKQVAIKKVLKYHQHFDMQPFFEWDLKMLPLVTSWFEQARSITNVDQAEIDKRNLNAIHQFIRGMPGVVEPLVAPAAGVKRKRGTL